MDALGLVLTPELKAVLIDPLISLMDHPALLKLTEEECQTRVKGVGSVLLQLLLSSTSSASRLNLDGDLIEDLRTRVAITTSTSTRSNVLVQQMLAFKCDHTIFDEELRPPLFRRDRPSYLLPTERISVEIKGTLKRKGGDELDEEKPTKRAKPGPKKA
ncbi:hypothetical protein B0H14DRAFT_3479973 [Mycena olivaceomarginata]|nr:hypothetical protein B0H14DRAFT_3479973 [Mycena olivaceomarginata]